jgi:carboxylate-amine ligase
MTSAENPSPPSERDLRAAFDGVQDLRIGLEEELMLVDAETLDLSPGAEEALRRLEGDSRFKLELPASQIEIVAGPVRNAGAAASQLMEARRGLVAAVGPGTRPIGAAVHPFAAALGELNRGGRYDLAHDDYGAVAEHQLVCALQVHVAIRGAERALAVYNALRLHLPEIAALAANAPFAAGRDTHLASMRPPICAMLPRQGIPPHIASWDWLARELDWGAAAGGMREPARWWWEMRLHPAFGTIEVRVPDSQATVADAAAVAAFVHALAAWLAERVDAGEAFAPVDSWRIGENRWSACRHGVEGRMADLATGELRTTRDRLTELADAIAPVAARLDCAGELEDARRLIEANGAMRQRAAAGEGPEAPRRATAWLADRFLAQPPR